MQPPPPTSTLFPYTTLFRSIALGNGLMRQDSFGAGTTIAAMDAIDGQRRPCRQPFKIDRKSTRLNSSHRCISYAVFCLKKKIYNIVTSRTPLTAFVSLQYSY